MTPRILAQLHHQGLTQQQIAARFGVSDSAVCAASARHNMTRWDAPGVLVVEIAARHDVTGEGVAKRAKSLGIPLKRWRGVLMVSKADAGHLDAYYAQQVPAEDYAHWLSTDQVAAVLGISSVAVSAAVSRGTPWAAALIVAQVRTRTRWAYRYCPRSVEAAKLKREGK